MEPSEITIYTSILKLRYSWREILNKRVFIIIIIIIIPLTIIFCFNLPKLKYNYGRDTYKLFGDGTFQIISSPASIYVLVNNQLNISIETKIFRYKEIKPFVYTQGENGYTVLNYKIGTIVQKKRLNELDAKYQKIFNQKSNFVNFD